MAGWFNATALQATTLQREASVLVLSDIHFDPFLTCHTTLVRPCPIIQQLVQAPLTAWPVIFQQNERVPPYRHDTSYALLQKMLEAAKKTIDMRQISYVLVLGDFLGHDFKQAYQTTTQDKNALHYAQFTNKVMAFLNHELRSAFASQAVYLLPGNNDSDQGDYVVPKTGSEFYRHFMSPTGYYAITLPALQLRILMLNTVLFSDQASGVALKTQALQEWHWLTAELNEAQQSQQMALLAMHIPERVSFMAVFGIPWPAEIRLWRVADRIYFHDLLDHYATEIVAILAGHIHRAWLMEYVMHAVTVPVFGVPAVSPIFGTRPAFQVYRYDRLQHTLTLLDTIHFT